METTYLQTPIGILELQASSEGLSSALFKEDIPSETPLQIPEVLQETVQQLSEYFEGNRT